MRIGFPACAVVSLSMLKLGPWGPFLCNRTESVCAFAGGGACANALRMRPFARGGTYATALTVCAPLLGVVRVPMH